MNVKAADIGRYDSRHFDGSIIHDFDTGNWHTGGFYVLSQSHRVGSRVDMADYWHHLAPH